MKNKIVNLFHSLKNIKIRTKLFIALFLYSFLISIIIGIILFNISYDKFYNVFLDQKLSLGRSFSWMIEPEIYAGFSHPDMKNDPDFEEYHNQMKKILNDESEMIWFYGVLLNKRDNKLYYALESKNTMHEAILVENTFFRFLLFVNDYNELEVHWNDEIYKDKFSIDSEGILFSIELKSENWKGLKINGIKVLDYSEKKKFIISVNNKSIDSKNTISKITLLERNDSARIQTLLRYIPKGELLNLPGYEFVETFPFYDKVMHSIQACKIYRSSELESNASGNFLNIIIPLSGFNNECRGALVLSLSPAIISDYKISTIRAIIGIAVLFIFMSIFLSYIISDLFLYPLYKLTNAVKELSSGNRSAIARVRSEDEFGLLAKTFNDLVDNLGKAYRENEALALIKNELEIAKQIQESILPKEIPNIPGIEIDVIYEPMAMVGGDFYDFSMLSNTKLGVIIADVSGHGVPASLIAAMLKVAFSIQSFDSLSPAELLENINAIMLDKCGTHFITANYISLDIQTKELILAKAGHPPLFIYSAKTKKVKFYMPPGRLIGVYDQLNTQNMRIKLKKKDRLILLTDGFLEVSNEKEELFGEEEFIQFFEEFGHLSSMVFKNLLIEKLKSWLHREGEIEFEDDLTLVLIDIL